MKVKQKELEDLSSDEIRQFFKNNDAAVLPKRMQDYVNSNNDPNVKNQRLNRIKTFLSIIIVDRFIKETL